MTTTKTIDILKKLVSINSVNPSLVEGAPGEGEIAQYIADFMQELGLKTQLEEVEPGRPNVIGVLEGIQPGPILLLNGHMDTVGIDHMNIDPLNPIVKEGRLYGRGSYDMKGGLAAMLAAAKSLVESGTEIHGSLILAAVCDEEYRSIGTEDLMKKVDADAAIVTESTELDIVIAHKGFAWIDVETQGVAAHGSKPEAGVDAIVKMGKFLMELDRLQNGSLKQKKHSLLGSPSIHASTIKGGLGLSTYPDYCKLQVERRLIPGETPDDVDTEMNSIITSLSDDDLQFNGSYNITFKRGPMEVRSDERICQILDSAILEVKGSAPDFVGMSGWLDSEIIWKKGVPVVIFGPRGRGAHAAVEYVELDSVLDTAQILEKVVYRFCNQQ